VSRTPASRIACLAALAVSAAACAKTGAGAPVGPPDPAHYAAQAERVRGAAEPLGARGGAFMLISGLTSPLEKRVRMVRQAFAEEGVGFADTSGVDTVLVTLPVRVGKRVVIYRAVLDPGADESLVFVEGFFADSSAGTVERVGQSDVGDEGRAWRTVFYVASWLEMQRRRGRE
jgi:hypothetical protein